MGESTFPARTKNTPGGSPTVKQRLLEATKLRPIRSKLIEITIAAAWEEPIANRVYIADIHVPRLMRARSSSGRIGHTIEAGNGGSAIHAHIHGGVPT